MITDNAGSTLKIVVVDSGKTADSAVFTILSGTETVVDTGTLTSSGNGHYYALYTTPSTPGYYVARTTFTVGGKPYVNAKPFQLRTIEVD